MEYGALLTHTGAMVCFFYLCSEWCKDHVRESKMVMIMVKLGACSVFPIASYVFSFSLSLYNDVTTLLFNVKLYCTVRVM